MNQPKNPPSPAIQEKKTLVEQGTDLKGSITSSCPVVVQGSVVGEVAGPAVEIAPTGSVSGKIVTSTLISKGHVAGELDVDTANVSGTVAHQTVVRASKLDMRLSSQTKKLELRFNTGSDDRKLS